MSYFIEDNLPKFIETLLKNTILDQKFPSYNIKGIPEFCKPLDLFSLIIKGIKIPINISSQAYMNIYNEIILSMKTNIY